MSLQHPAANPQPLAPFRTRYMHLWCRESPKEQHLCEIKLFRSNVKVFAVNFDKFIASFLNKSINQKKNLSDPKLLHGSILTPPSSVFSHFVRLNDLVWTCLVVFTCKMKTDGYLMFREIYLMFRVKERMEMSWLFDARNQLNKQLNLLVNPTRIS